MNRIDATNEQVRRICAHALCRSAKISERKKYILASEYLSRRYGFCLTAATLKLKSEAVLKGIQCFLFVGHDDLGFDSEGEAQKYNDQGGAENLPMTIVRPDGQEDGHLAILKLIYNQLSMTTKTLVRIAESLESSGKGRLMAAIDVLESESGNPMR
jgi:hypothetical protein